MNDISLRQFILDELEFEPSLNAAHIGVAVEDGIATLTGHVRSYAEKVTVEHVVQRVKGVRGIAFEIEVRYPNDKKVSDEEIAKRALNSIAWNATVPGDKVKVEVRYGWITLFGEVDWNFQKVAAEETVRKLSGILGVYNEITVRPHADAANVKTRIEDALKRNAEIEASDIHVGVSGSKVVLEGRVQSWHERNVAEAAAWAVPGVIIVDDRLVIS